MGGGHQGNRGEGGEERKGEGGERGEEILADGHMGQPKVVEEVLADLKLLLTCVTDCGPASYIDSKEGLNKR